MQTASKCPDPIRWDELLDSRLPEAAAADLSRHLENCAGCQRTLDRLTSGEKTWIDAARVLEQRSRPALQRAIDELKSEGDAGLETAEANSRDTETLPFLRPSVSSEHRGRLGSYEVVGVLGRGGMGVVLKAFDTALQRPVAIKVLAPNWGSHKEARRRFEREARAAALVRHENVVAIHAVDEVEGLPYLVMEYVPGTSLQQRIDKVGPLDLNEILGIGAQAAAGLAAAHARGLIHRDIKPANILIDTRGRVRLTDFGLARAVDDSSLTQSGVIAGTPQYMAPEQARGVGVDHRADLFSLGSVLFSMCTGEAPFRAPTTVAVLRRLCDEPPPDVRDLNPQIPDWLADIIDRLHAKRPRDRFRNAAELARLLNRHLAHLRSPETVEKPGALPAPRKFGWRLAASIIAAGLVLCSLAVGILIWSVQSPSATTNQQAESREPPKPAPPEKVDVYFQKLRADLDDPNVHTCREALARLATMKPNSQRADVAKRLVALTEVEDTHIRRPAIVTLGVWGSENEVPALMKAMEHPDVFTRREALKVIGRFRDRRSLPVVIRCLRDFFTRADAEKAMCELGPMAEADVLVILNETDVGLKKSAIQVLADIGTEASVPALTEIANHGKVFFMEPARQALNAIAARKKQ